MSTALRTYYRGDDLVAMVDNLGARRYYYFDHQGTTQCLTNQAGAVTDRFASDAWGVQVKRTGSSINRHWYVGASGHYRDIQRSTDYVRLRIFSAPQGRWLTPDPLPLHPIILAPVSAGYRTILLDLLSTRAPSASYAYAHGNPALHLDPSGLRPTVGGGNCGCISVGATASADKCTSDLCTALNSGGPAWGTFLKCSKKFLDATGLAIDTQCLRSWCARPASSGIKCYTSNTVECPYAGKTACQKLNCNIDYVARCAHTKNPDAGISPNREIAVCCYGYDYAKKCGIPGSGAIERASRHHPCSADDNQLCLIILHELVHACSGAHHGIDFESAKPFWCFATCFSGYEFAGRSLGCP